MDAIVMIATLWTWSAQSADQVCGAEGRRSLRDARGALPYATHVCAGDDTCTDKTSVQVRLREAQRVSTIC